MFVGAKLATILCLLMLRTSFFIYTNYLTIVCYNQPCIAFIYTLYIILQIKEKEPLPLSVEVLLHAAARAATFFNCTATWAVYSVGLLLFVTLTFQSYAVIQTATRPAVKSAIPAVSILCSRTDCSGKDTQQLHFLHNIALCILLFFGAVIMVFC